MLLLTLLFAAPLLDLHEETLPNQLTVIYAPDAQAQEVAVGVAYRTSNVKGSPRLNLVFMYAEQQRGVDGEGPGIAAGRAGGREWLAPGFDQLQFGEIFEPGKLGVALHLEAQRMRSWKSLGWLDEERLEAAHNAAARALWTGAHPEEEAEATRLAFGAGHPYEDEYDRGEIWGTTVGDLAALTKGFGPANAVLVIAGDFDMEAARKLVVREFGAIPAGPVLERKRVLRPLLTAPLAMSVARRESVSVVMMVWPLQSMQRSRESAVAEVTARILGGSRTARGKAALISAGHLAGAVDSRVYLHEMGGRLKFVADGVEGVAIGSLEKGMLDVLRGLRDEGPTEDQVREAREGAAMALLAELEFVECRVADLFEAAESAGIEEFPDRDLAQLRAVTAADVQAFAQQHLQEGNRIQIVNGSRKP